MIQAATKCVSCGAEFQAEWWLCPLCNGSLELKASLPSPVANPIDLRLGEGNTPLLRLRRLSGQLGCDLWAKCEFANPTGAFKDRGSIVEVAQARALGRNGVVCASTGNMAASLAAYAAKAGLPCKVVVPDDTPSAKLRQAIMSGAVLIRVEGTYDDCVALAERIAKEEGYFLCGDYALRREGQKSIGRELSSKDFNGFVVGVGNGTVGIAIAQGLKEASPDRPQPRFIGVQPEQINPIEKAWRTNASIRRLKGGSTIATAMSVRRPLDGAMTLQLVAETGGLLTTVTDNEIINAQSTLAEQEGLYVERTSAAPLAMLLRDKDQYAGQKLVMILTGSGFKDN